MTSTFALKNRLLNQAQSVISLIDNLDHSLKKLKHKELMAVSSLKLEISKISDQSLPRVLTDYEFQLSEIQNRVLAKIKEIQNEGEEKDEKLD